ncbi:Retrovirus-related Pol polyprotein from transposon 17.6 [Gossypium australe]|uniref:Retrovirus-related Pol polyprotein from transposon 17.6 n=1 Tax=Gossypium australe TaxID=47621 RepID=A0A5B6WFR2_9ROSI|nr:Retrovirus-related Pol polyprotein from transposon 17.6 [Gossypium australe]
MAIKVEKQLKRKGTVRGYSTVNTSKWSRDVSKNTPPNRAKEPMVPGKSNKPMVESSKGKAVESFPNRSRDIKCFKCLRRGHFASQCPNRSTMVVRANGEIESEEETEMIPKPYPTKRRTWSMLLTVNYSSLKSLENEQQRKNIFHTQCQVQGKVCSVIIDGGSCTNVANTIMVEKLGLPTTNHSSPYKLQWLNDDGELKVTKQVLVSFSIR